MTVSHVPFVVCLLSIGLIGCGTNDPWSRIPLGGEVSIDAVENVEASITFLPAEGVSGPSATTTVSAGRFQFDSTNGPVSGPHRVIIMPQEGPAAPPSPRAPGTKDSSAPTAPAPSQPAASFARMETTVTVPAEGDLHLKLQFNKEG